MADAAVERAVENANNWYSYFDKNNEKYRDHIAFVRGEQWDDAAAEAQRRLHKPILTVNKLYPTIKQIIGEFRSFVPDYKIRDERLSGEPMPQQALNVIADLMRSIDYESNAKQVRIIAAQNALTGGYGAFRIYAERDRINPFVKTLRYQAFHDSTSAFFDPNAEKITKTDGMYGGGLSIMSKDTFEQVYNREAPTQSLFTQYKWIQVRQDEQIVIADYYEKTFEKEDRLLLSDNRVIKGDDWKATKKEYDRKNQQADQIFPPLTVVEEIRISVPRITIYKIAGDELLEDAVVWPGQRLPIVFCDGDSVVLDGQQETTTFTEFVQDAQRYLNYIKSDMAWSVQSLRREIFLASPVHVAGFEDIWKSPERVQGRLPYMSDMAGDPRPTRLPIPEIPQSLLQQYESTQFDLKEGLGMFEASRGQPGNEISGVAVNSKIAQSNLSNFIYVDNMVEAIQEGAQIVAEVLPAFHADERQTLVRSRDGKSKLFTLNKKEEDKSATSVMLKQAALNVEITAAAPFRAQKQQELQVLLSLIQASGNPATFNLVADLLAKYADTMLRDQLIDRFKTLVPPQILEQEGEKPPPQPPNQQAQIQQQILQKNMEIEERTVAAKETTAQANMLKARASAGDVIGKHATTQQKSAVELRKAELEIQGEILRLHGEVAKLQQQQQQ